MIVISDGAAHRKSSSRYQEVRYMQVSKSGDMVAGRVARDMPDRGGLLTISWSLGSDKKD